uniref:probable ATP-dependent RNA helicase DDX27 n=1 Tax=Ciona intestinalis TaxID=7719 RepID=UPI000180BEE6|nr:probable ATP-dependent RNA helicase DDX27 [Ciona intestinalis]|eukprot:XP_002125988.1 probable ATP-dependent RNA helicase DDX27 [Ciona intestinalis]
MDLIQTIEEGTEVTLVSEDSESDEELTLVSKKQRTEKKLESKGFNPSFQFEDDGFYESKWTLESALHDAIKKKKMHSTLDQKIDEVRRNRITVIQQIPSNPQDEEDVVSDDDEELDLEDVSEAVSDKLKFIEKKRKKKRKVDSEEKIVQIPLAEIKDGSGVDKNVSWDPNLGFQQMNISRPLLKAISEINYVTPTPIQQAAIPIGLLGRDICACAATGTGKTAAFMLPVLERLLYRTQSTPITRVLCLVPTRELAVQVYSVTHHLAQHSNLRICLAAGGLDMKSQEAALRQGPDIVIATPGRLIDHLHNTPSFDLQMVEILILDEADRMLDEFFEDQMNEIIKLCSHHRQTMLFSATMSEQVQELAAVSLKNPVKIFVNSNTDVAPFLRQEFIRIRETREGDREAIVAALCSRSFISNVLVFTQTKKQAHRMHIVLGLLGLKAGELHGNLSQGQRLESLKRFKNGDIDILVCTDLAARGLDIENVKTVINLTMPNTQQHYVHRVGRTARAGKSGRSVSLVGETERKLLKEIVKFAKNPVKSRVVPPDVISKFRDKLNEIESEVGDVMKMEAQEKQVIASENQVKKAEKIIKGEAPEKRAWFQNKMQREFAKAERMLGTHSESKKRGKKMKNKSGSTSTNNPEDRVKRELEKTQAFQHREQKRGRKQKRARSCAEPVPVKTIKIQPKKKKSSFDKELTRTGKKSLGKHRDIKRRKNKKR